MFITENDSREENILQVARAMMTAARTAPKGCGKDNLEIALLTGENLAGLASEMRKIGERDGRGFFLRDAGNVEASQAAVILGCHRAVRGLNCGMCGYATCAEKAKTAPEVPCVFDVTDLGIAVGSAAAVAADYRADNRVLFSAGVAVREMGLLPNCPIVYVIPLSASGKSVFFDRQSVCAK